MKGTQDHVGTLGEGKMFGRFLGDFKQITDILFTYVFTDHPGCLWKVN